MPRDSNGNYSLPPGYQGTPGNTIQVSQHNPPLEDLAAAMTDSLPRSGAAPMTGPLKVQPGSASSPSIAPSINPSIGFWFDSAGVHVSGNLVGARYLGELIPWTRVTAPALCVLPYGQTLLRSAYPDLWAIAQTEIAAGNSFYNNGNGSTTFGIGDLRGRVIAGNDSMGGTPANRITVGNFGSTPSFIGSFGGAETHILTIAQLAAHSHANTLSDPGHSHNYQIWPTTSAIIGASNFAQPTGAGSASTSSSFTGITINNASAGSGSAHNNMQPTMICNFALYVGA